MQAVPSRCSPVCTTTNQGDWRVPVGAQAQALENQCFVDQAPTVGMAPWSPVLDENHDAAGLFGQPDGDAPDDSVVAMGKLDIDHWVFAEVEPARVQSRREKARYASTITGQSNSP